VALVGAEALTRRKGPSHLKEALFMDIRCPPTTQKEDQPKLHIKF
jgi:hypothetical protein